MMQTQLACQYIIDELTDRLSPQLTYHTVQHTLDVVEQAMRIARAEGIVDEKMLTLLTTAAYYHDSGFVQVYNEHEEISCLMAQEALPRFGYDHSQIEQVCQMIRATRMPQTPATLLEAILCDADLDYLGRDDYYPISQSLYLEWVTYNLLPEPGQWSSIQRSFLSNHRYFTASNRQLRDPGKLRVLLALAV